MLAIYVCRSERSRRSSEWPRSARAVANQRTECDGSCRRELDPPRFCPECGKKMFAQVTPDRISGAVQETRVDIYD